MQKLKFYKKYILDLIYILYYVSYSCMADFYFLELDLFYYTTSMYCNKIVAGCVFECTPPFVMLHSRDI